MVRGNKSNIGKYLFILLIIFGSIYLLKFLKSKNSIELINNDFLINNNQQLKTKVSQIEEELTSPDIDLKKVNILDGYKTMKIAEVYQYGKFDFPKI